MNTAPLAADPLFALEGRVIAVTGASGQLGRQFCRCFLKRGATVAGIDVVRSSNLPQDLADAERDRRLLIVETDVTNRAALVDAKEKIAATLGPVRGLVTAAALDSPPGAPATENGPFETYPEESWDRVMTVNAKGVMLSCQVFGGAMAHGSGGSIVMIASIYGMLSPDQSLYNYRRTAGDVFFKPVAYSASKSALLNLVRYLATYWARAGVRVNAISPAGIFNSQDPRFLERYNERVPMGRMARPDEIDGALVYLLSDASTYVTGTNLVVDGGFSAW